MCRVTCADVLIYAICVSWLRTVTAQLITAEQLQSLVEKRVEALSLVADDAYRNITEQNYQTCPYGNQLYDTCSVSLRPSDVQFDTTFKRDISTSVSSVYFRQFLAGFAALNSSIDYYRVLQGIFARLCMSEALSNSWILLGNVSSGDDYVDGLLWHFYGDDETAIIRNYPYFSHDPSSELCLQRQLDPRFRPWYVSTVTSSKAVYVILHSTTFDLLPLMRAAAIRLVNTLSHQDFFYFILTSGSSYNSDFVSANETIRARLEQFITTSTNQQLVPTLNIAVLLTEAFQLFRLLGNQSVCHWAVVLLSDTSLDQSVVDAVAMAKQQNDVLSLDIHTLTFGIEADGRFAALLSCENGGDHFVVRDIPGVDEAIASYYRFYSAAVAMDTNNSRVSWSEVYSDFFLSTDVVSACSLVRNVKPVELLGVTCVDVNVTYFRSLNNGVQVLSSLVEVPSLVTCPSIVITEEIRNALRVYKYCGPPANLSDIDQLMSLYRNSTRLVVNLLISAQTDVRSIVVRGLPMEQCPYGATVYDSCSDTTLRYTFNSRLRNNVTNITSSINFSPTALDQINGFPLVDYSINNPLFEPLCYSSIAERQWRQLLSLYPQAALQYYASDDGFIRLYPAIRYDECYPPSYDPRTRPFYAASTSGRKDVVMVIDITNNDGLSVALAAVRDLLNTLSVLDYFDIITSSHGSYSNSTGLTAATPSNKLVVNITHLPNIVAMDTNQSTLVAKAFDSIMTGRSNGVTAGCQLAIIIITDRLVTMDTSQVVANGNNQVVSLYQTKPAKVFINSLTDDLPGYHDEIAVQLTCKHSGIWNEVSLVDYTQEDHLLVISYYRVLALAVMVTQPVWSEVYDDYTGAGQVVTLCQPHYDEINNIGHLLGVACADVTIEMLQQVGASVELVSTLINEQSVLPCQQSELLVTALEPLRPMNAKCLSAPPTRNAATLSRSTAMPTVSSTLLSRSGSSDNGLGAGAIAGIVISIVVLFSVTLIILIGWYYCHNIRRYRSHDYWRHLQGQDDEALSDALVSEEDDNNGNL